MCRAIVSEEAVWCCECQGLSQPSHRMPWRSFADVWASVCRYCYLDGFSVGVWVVPTDAAMNGDMHVASERASDYVPA